MDLRDKTCTCRKGFLCRKGKNWVLGLTMNAVNIPESTSVQDNTKEFTQVERHTDKWGLTTHGDQMSNTLIEMDIPSLLVFLVLL